MAQEKALEAKIPLASKMGSRARGLGRLARRKPLGAAAALVLLLLVFAAVAAPWLAPYDYLEPHPREALQGPSAKYWLGTDNSGRDVLSRIIFGARTSVFIASVVVSTGVTIGAVIGLITGYWAGRMIDIVGQRLVDTLQSIPSIVKAMAILAVLGQEMQNLIIALSLATIPTAARVVRGATQSTKENVYVEAAHAIGCGDLRIMVRHIFPQVVAPIIIIASVQLGQVIIAEASLSFLGLGAPPPHPSWGGMLQIAASSYMIKQPLLSIWPGLAITLVVLSFNLWGDALRDVLDPRLRSR